MSKIIGAHNVIHTTNPAADRAFFSDVLKFSNVDTGGGWLIFGLPASEVAFHPASANGLHEFYLLCDDIESFVKEMKNRKIDCSTILYLEWGMLTQLTLPGGGMLGIYQPKHKRPKPVRPEKSKRKISFKLKTKKVAKKNLKTKSKKK